MNLLTISYLNRDTSSNRIVLKEDENTEHVLILEAWKDDWSERLWRDEKVFDSQTGQLLRCGEW